MINNKYTCYSVSGGGTETKHGTWEIKETDKLLTFTLLDEPFWEPNVKKIKIEKYYRKGRTYEDEDIGGKPAFREKFDVFPYTAYMNNGHVARKWEDGTWTVYPNQSGTPHVFEPVL